jgi:hypothetical protein
MTTIRKGKKSSRSDFTVPSSGNALLNQYFWRSIIDNNALQHQRMFEANRMQNIAEFRWKNSAAVEQRQKLSSSLANPFH